MTERANQGDDEPQREAERNQRRQREATAPAKPSQAEGDRTTIDEALREHGQSGSSQRADHPARER